MTNAAQARGGITDRATVIEWYRHELKGRAARMQYGYLPTAFKSHRLFFSDATSEVRELHAVVDGVCAECERRGKLK